MNLIVTIKTTRKKAVLRENKQQLLRRKITVLD